MSLVLVACQRTSEAPCHRGTVRCDAACTTLSADPRHCGGCGIACAATELCSAGACVDTCALAGQTRCGESCVDLSTTAAHCGACGVACTAGEVCRGGGCVDVCALAGTTRCGDACVDVATDPSHCGACGTACDAGAVCRAAGCVDGCALAGTARCGASCVDLDADPASCGTCGNACAATAVCRAGACVDVCTLAGTTRCGDSCVDLRADAASCGACGHACPGWGVCVAGSCAPAACPGGVAFPDAPVFVPGPGISRRVLLADLNRDGRDDLIVVATPSEPYGAPPVLSVALSAPGGGFQAADTYLLPAGGPIVIADLDGDGDLDLNVGSDTSPSRLWNDGTGHLVVQRGTAGLVAIADLDGDGVLDRVVGGISLEVQLSTTTTVQRFYGYGSSIVAARAADLTGDGVPELVLGWGTYPTLEVYLNSGRGSLTRVSYESPEVPDLYGGAQDLALADLDGDGALDVVVLTGGGVVVAALNDGAGGFGSFARRSPAEDGFGYAYGLFVGDANEDGRPDALLSGPFGFLVAPGDGTGRFGEPTLVRAGWTFAVALTDVDADGHPDLVGAVWSGLAVSAGRGRGAFAQTPWLPLPAAYPFAWTLAAADLDRDGRSDLVAFLGTTGVSGAIGVLRAGRGAVDLYPLTAYAAGVVVADVDGDHVPDLLVPDYSSYNPLLLRGRGDGTFDPAVALTAITGTSVLVGDVSGDGIADLVAVGHYSGDPIRVALGRGDRRFDPVVTGTTLPGYDQIALADVDGDGRSDLVLALAAGGGVTFRTYRSLGDGSFAAPVARTVAVAGARAVTLADLDGDGRADLAFVAPATGAAFDAPSRIAVLYAGPDGFEAPAWYELPGPVDALAAARVSGGRRRDLVAALSPQHVLAVLPAQGARGFGAPILLAQAAGPLAAADVDGDLRDELVVNGGYALTTVRARCAP
jgi:hypothetical protein